ncbi:Ubiquitin-protein ligase E3B [Operophtera brumata]|uniref:HECT-type E3 ubiquitin transferase n=1 Tax=Operophtera brumata TaxID=104452 RepID=A0A0L7LS36_OPEBR|nr:Ubiquitin-protein ligase E3B [Operophtera brumata]
MYPVSVKSKESFLEQTKAAREERAYEKKREQSAVTIQAVARGWIARQRFYKRILDDFDQTLPEASEVITQEGSSQPLELVSALDVYRATCRLFLIFKQQRDRKRFEKLCKYIVHSLHSDSVKLSYVGVFLNKDYRPESPVDMQSILVHLHTLLEFTATNTWALTRSKNFEKLRGGMTQLCANVMGSLFHKGYFLTLKKVFLKNISLTAIVTLSLRPLVSAQFSEKLLTMYIIQILSVPALSITVFRSHSMFDKCVEFLSTDQNMRIQYVVCKKGNLSNWHPILGWFSQSFDLSLLWGAPLLKKLLAQPIKEMVDGGVTEEGAGPSQPSTPVQSSNPAAFIRRAIEARTNRSNANKNFRKLGSPDSTKAALICSMYHTALQTMTQFLYTLGPNCGLKSFLDLLAVNSKTTAPEFQMLILFADCMTHYLQDFINMSLFLNMFVYKTVMGQLLEPFKLQDFINMSLFLNMFVYKTVMGQLLDLKTIQNNELFASLHTLLLVLVQKTPHMIAHGDRVRLFRRAVADEKFLEETIKRVFDPSLNLFRATSEERLYPSPTSCLQDNHLQLFEFIGRMLGKAVYEGIVVDVPFASFFLSQVLGQTQQALYSWIDELPSLDRDLYRSLTYIKHFQVPHTAIGLLPRLTQQALYSWIDELPSLDRDLYRSLTYIKHFQVPHTAIGLLPRLTQQALYSWIDELPSLDRDLYRSLTYIKHFQGDVSTLELTFSIDEERLGSNERVHKRIQNYYKSRVALTVLYTRDLRDLRRHTQYYGGFHDSHRVVCWLWDVLQRDFTEQERAMFLKYYGGFHDSHRVVCWLWDVLQRDFTEQERAMFLKYYGGFHDSHRVVCWLWDVLQRDFTEQERAKFLKKDPLHRLPTSSTCFNLLKLPNYQKRSTLRDKLRYAVNSNTGFELS